MRTLLAVLLLCGGVGAWATPKKAMAHKHKPTPHHVLPANRQRAMEDEAWGGTTRRSARDPALEPSIGFAGFSSRPVVGQRIRVPGTNEWATLVHRTPNHTWVHMDDGTDMDWGIAGPGDPDAWMIPIMRRDRELGISESVGGGSGEIGSIGIKATEWAQMRAAHPSPRMRAPQRYRYVRLGAQH